MFERTKALVFDRVGKACPSAAFAVGVQNSVFRRGFCGHQSITPERLPLTPDTKFDLASLSKLVSTAAVALRLTDRGVLSPDEPIGKYLDDPGNYGDCRISHLLTHTSGLVPGIALYAPEYRNRPSLEVILTSPPLSPPGEEVRYSCMGFIVLQHILENATGKPLDVLASELVFAPLGMTGALYCPPKGTVTAATEYPDSTGLVHDENARFLGGVSGNAGVFATLDDLIPFAAMCSAHGRLPSGREFISRSLFDLAVKNHTPGMTDARGLGIQLKFDSAGPMGTLMSQGSFGHTGFTGTSLYVDSQTGLWGILLTNAVHLGRDNREGYFALRREFYDLITEEYATLI